MTLPLAAGVTEVGDRPQVTVPLLDEQVNPTAPLKLFTDVTVIVEVVELPTTVVAEAGDALIVKSGAAPTFRV